MAITDHDIVTDLEAVKEAYPDMVFFDGLEYTQDNHFLFVGESVPSLYKLPLDRALDRADGLLTIVAHPDLWVGQPYWTPEKILSLGRLPGGIEIFDGHYSLPSALARGLSPLYTHVWDDLLTAGYRLWGFASDDFHDPADFDNGFNMVRVREVTATAIMQALKGGRFYASTGLLLEKVRERDGYMEVCVQAPCVGRFVGSGGKTLAESAGRAFAYQVTDEAYVRFEAEGDGGMLFLQPMFLAG
jgi:hypothetical protein